MDLLAWPARPPQRSQRPIWGLLCLLPLLLRGHAMEDPRRWDRDFQRFSPEGRLYQVRRCSAWVSERQTGDASRVLGPSGPVCGEGCKERGTRGRRQQRTRHGGAVRGATERIHPGGPGDEREDLGRAGEGHESCSLTVQLTTKCHTFDALLQETDWTSFLSWGGTGWGVDGVRGPDCRRSSSAGQGSAAQRELLVPVLGPLQDQGRGALHRRPAAPQHVRPRAAAVRRVVRDRRHRPGWCAADLRDRAVRCLPRVDGCMRRRGCRGGWKRGCRACGDFVGVPREARG